MFLLETLMTIYFDPWRLIHQQYNTKVIVPLDTGAHNPPKEPHHYTSFGLLTNHLIYAVPAV